MLTRAGGFVTGEAGRWVPNLEVGMSNRSTAEKIKTQNIIDMAITFTAMVRVFEKKSKKRIADKLYKVAEQLEDIHTREQFEKVHREFCHWFVAAINTAERNLTNQTKKEARAASYGHAAKVFDIVMKVYVYYSQLPTKSAAERLIPWLHAGVDTPIMKYLNEKFPSDAVPSQTVEQVDKKTYARLQKLVQRDISESFNGEIVPVQFDDVKWNELNRNKRA